MKFVIDGFPVRQRREPGQVSDKEKITFQKFRLLNMTPLTKHDPSTQPSCLNIILDYLPGQDWSFSTAPITEVISGGAEPGHTASLGS